MTCAMMKPTIMISSSNDSPKPTTATMLLSRSSTVTTQPCCSRTSRSSNGRGRAVCDQTPPPGPMVPLTGTQSGHTTCTALSSKRRSVCSDHEIPRTITKTISTTPPMMMTVIPRFQTTRQDSDHRPRRRNGFRQREYGRFRSTTWRVATIATVSLLILVGGVSAQTIECK